MVCIALLGGGVAEETQYPGAYDEV